MVCKKVDLHLSRFSVGTCVFHSIPLDWLAAGYGDRALMSETLTVASHELRRLPGLFRRWELAQLIEAGEDYRIEDAGTAGDGTALFAVYKAATSPLYDKTGGATQ